MDVVVLINNYFLSPTGTTDGRTDKRREEERTNENEWKGKESIKSRLDLSFHYSELKIGLLPRLGRLLGLG